MKRRTFRMPAPRALAILGAMLMLLAGCGARLTAAQEAAANGVNGGGVSSGGGSTGNGSTSALGSSTGGTATTLAGGTSAGGSSAGGTSGGSGGSVTGGSAGSAGKAGTSGSSGSSGSSGGTQGVGAVANPLVGPNGKLCPSGAPSSDPGVTASTITLGNISTINGPVPGLFAGARYGAQAVAAYINSLGGLCGRKVVVNSADDQFDQATDQNEAQTMAGQVLAFLGSFSLQDGGIPAGAPNVPDVGETLSAQRFGSATNFSPSPNAPGYQTGPFLWFKQNPQYADATQHMALLVENTPQTATTGKWMADALQSIGYKFIFTDTNLQPTDPTFNGDVQKMKQDGVTGVVFQATGTIIGQLANAMYSAGMKIVLGDYCGSAYDPAYIKNAGPGVAGSAIELTTSMFEGEDAATNPMVATFDQWYSRVDPGQAPDLYALYSWMSGLLLAQGINSGGAPTRAALLAGLKTITNFTGDGLAAPANPVAKTPPSCWIIVDVKNNKFVRDPATPSGFTCSPSGYFHES